MKLKPCPFCGSDDLQDLSFTWSCNGCGAMAGKEVWNRRDEKALREDILNQRDAFLRHMMSPLTKEDLAAADRASAAAAERAKKEGKP